MRDGVVYSFVDSLFVLNGVPLKAVGAVYGRAHAIIECVLPSIRVGIKWVTSTRSLGATSSNVRAQAGGIPSYRIASMVNKSAVE